MHITQSVVDCVFFCYNYFAMTKVNVKCVASEGAVIPEYKTAGAAGADVCAHIDSDIEIAVGKSAMIPTGLFFEIPEGFFLKSQKATKSRCALVQDSPLKTV